MKRLFLLVLLTALGAAGYFAVKRLHDNSGDNLGQTMLYGSIDLRDVSLASSEQERIREVLVEEGEQVSAGQVLARLNPDRLAAAIDEMRAKILAQKQVIAKLENGNRPQEIEQAAAELEVAKIELASAEQVLARVKATASSGATSRQALDDATTQVNLDRAKIRALSQRYSLLVEGPRQEDITSARHQLTALQANLDQLQVRFGELTLVAPSAGTVQSRILEPGEMAGPGRPVLTLALNQQKWVRAYLPEPQLGHVKIGMAAEVFSDSFPGQPVEGWVSFISPTAEFTPRTVQTEDLRTRLVYETRIQLRDPENRLRLGTPVTVRLIGESGANSIPVGQASQPSGNS